MKSALTFNTLPAKRRPYISGVHVFVVYGIIVALVIWLTQAISFIPIAVIVGIGLCVLLPIFINPDYLPLFQKENRLKSHSYPKIKYTELPFANKINGRISISSSVEINSDDPFIEAFTYSRHWFAPDYLVVHIQLRNTLPNIIVDASQNDSWLRSDVPAQYRNFTRDYSLEGDFPDYFRVHADTQSPVEVLQLLSPDLMVFFIDNLPDFNIEFINHSVFITTRNKFIDKSRFIALIESGISLANKLARKSQNMRGVSRVYSDRISH